MYELTLPTNPSDININGKLYFECCSAKSYRPPIIKTYTANMFIIGERYDLRNVRTLKEIGLSYFTLKLCRWSAKYNLINVLDMIDSKYSVAKYFTEEEYFKSIIHTAIINDNVSVLDWFHGKKHHLYYYIIDEATKLASMLEKINILEWFRNSKYTFEYNDKLILELLKNRKMNSLKWYIMHKCPLDYIDRYDTPILTAFDDFLIYGDIDILNAWVNNYGRRYIRYTERGCDFLVKHNKVDIIEWMNKNNLKLITKSKSNVSNYSNVSNVCNVSNVSNVSNVPDDLNVCNVSNVSNYSNVPDDLNVSNVCNVSDDSYDSDATIFDTVPFD
jgi:hypothetical protein